MDQSTGFARHDRQRMVARLAESIAASIDAAKAVEKPFFHLEFDRVFGDPFGVERVGANHGATHSGKAVKVWPCGYMPAAMVCATKSKVSVPLAST